MSDEPTTKVRRVARRASYVTLTVPAASSNDFIAQQLKEGEERALAKRRVAAVCEIAERAFSNGFTSIRVPLDHGDVQAMRCALRDMERVGCVASGEILDSRPTPTALDRERSRLFACQSCGNYHTEECP